MGILRYRMVEGMNREDKAMNRQDVMLVVDPATGLSATEAAAPTGARRIQ